MSLEFAGANTARKARVMGPQEFEEVLAKVREDYLNLAMVLTMRRGAGNVAVLQAGGAYTLRADAEVVLRSTPQSGALLV